MYQIDNASAAASQPASSAPGTAGFFTDGNPATSVPATIVPGEWLNAVMLEIINAITGSGQTLNKSAFNQLLKAIQTAAGYLGNYANTVGISSATTFTASQAGSYFNLAGTAPQTHTLPLTTACQNGALFTFKNTSSGVLTMTRQGSTDVISVDGSNLTSVSFNPGDDLFVVKMANGYWLAWGSSVLANSGQFHKSFTVNGYQKLPGGFILQWGSATTSTSADVPVAFPVAFPANLVGLAFGPISLSANGASIGSNSATVSGFNINGWTLNPTPTRNPVAVLWIAVGF